MMKYTQKSLTTTNNIGKLIHTYIHTYAILCLNTNQNKIINKKRALIKSSALLHGRV